MQNFRWLVFALFLLTIFIRLPALAHPQPIDDEDVYAVVGNEIVDGGRPYAEAVERKPPLLFWIYAAIFKLFGKYNWPALHVVAVAWVLATMAGLYAIGRGLFDRATGLFAALLYCIFQPWATFKNLAFNGEMIMNLPIALAWAIGLHRGSSRWRPELFLAGILLCTAFLFKQPAAIAAVPLGLFLLLPHYRQTRGLTFLQCIMQAAILTAGFFCALTVVALTLRAQGILGDAYFWTITGHAIPHFFWTKCVLRTLAFAGACLPLLLAVVISWRERRGIWEGKSAEFLALLGLLMASAIGTSSGARFYPHYYIQLIPPLAILAAPVFAQLLSCAVQPRVWFLRPPILATWLAAIILLVFLFDWIRLAPLRADSETGKYLAEHSRPNDRIFVWGQSTRIYLEARRRPACRYVVTFPLTGYVFGWDPAQIVNLDTREWIVPGAWDNLEKDFAKHPPAYIVDVQVPEKNAHYPVRDFPVLSSLLSRSYHPVTRTTEGVIYRRNSDPGV
jgi:4-amino-4-deoxy-L-arabinose transferase-like glycosyltransferase